MTQNNYYLNLTYKFISNVYFQLTIYTLLIIYGTVNHEVWRDEVDVWLFVRDVSSFSEGWNYLRNSGHPGLWHLIILPFAKLGFSPYIMHILNGSFAIVSAYLFLKFCPINFILKYFVLLSYFFAFEYSVIARNYMIAILFIFSIASIYEDRWKRPILFGFLVLLLANTNLFGTFIASGISLTYLTEMILEKKINKQIISSLFICALGGILVIIQIIPTSDSQMDLMTERFTNPFTFVITTIYAFTPAIRYWQLGAVIDILLIIFSFIYLFRTPRVLIFYIWTIMCIFGFHTFIYLAGYRHAGFLLIVFIFAYWISFSYPKKNVSNENNWKYFNIIYQILFVVVFSFSIKYTHKIVKNESKFEYSGSYLAAKFIIENGFDKPDTNILAYSADKVKTILFYLKNIQRIHYPNRDDFGSYRIWTKSETLWEIREIHFQKIALELWTKKDLDKKKTLVILTLPINEKYKKYFKFLFYSGSGKKFVSDEDYYIYQFIE